MGSIAGSNSGDLILIEKISELTNKINSLTSQLEHANEEISKLNSNLKGKVDTYPKQLSSPPTETGNVSYFFNVTANWSNGIIASSKGFFVSFGSDAVVIASNYQHLWFSFRNNGSWGGAIQVK